MTRATVFSYWALMLGLGLIGGWALARDWVTIGVILAVGIVGGVSAVGIIIFDERMKDEQVVAQKAQAEEEARRWYEAGHRGS